MFSKKGKKQYEEEFKRKLVIEHTSTGAKPAEIAKKYKIPDSTLRDWISKFGNMKKRNLFNSPVFNSPITAPKDNNIMSTSTPVPYTSLINQSLVPPPVGVSYIITEDDSEIFINNKNDIRISNSELLAIEQATLNLSTDTCNIEQELATSK